MSSTNANLDGLGTSADILASYQNNIAVWDKRVNSLLQEKINEKSPTIEEEKTELNHLTTFLNGRLTKRLENITRYPEDMQVKYLKYLEPFYTDDGISRFMGHYFDVEVFKKIRLRYRKKKDFEQEVGILFDLYRVKKTIETITTLQKSVKSDEPFVSLFTVEEQTEFLGTLKEIFKLFFVRFVKSEYRKELFQTLSDSKLETDQVIEMRKKGMSYINPEVIKGNEYRNKFITVYFSTQIRTKTNTKVNDLHFNYLNFELIKNEFLVNWMHKKLSGNREKDKILQKYKIGSQSVADLIKANPEKESEILASIPLDVFNDMAEEINQNVKEKDKTPVSSFSKNFGVFAKLQSTFQEVKQIARFSVDKMEAMKPKTKIWTVKKKARVMAETPKVEEKPKQEKVPKKEIKAPFTLTVLRQEDLNFPFFDTRTDTYRTKLDFFKKKTGTEYETFKKGVLKLFSTVSKKDLIIRTEPIREWVLPLLFKHEKKSILLIIGAEIAKRDQAGYKSKWKEDVFAFDCYFTFATQNKLELYGKVTGERKVKQIPFYQYAFAKNSVIKEAMRLFGLLLLNLQKEIFKSSNLTYRKEDQPFEELEELKKLIGMDPDNKNQKESESQEKTKETAFQPEAKQPSSTPDTDISS